MKASSQWRGTTDLRKQSALLFTFSGKRAQRHARNALMANLIQKYRFRGPTTYFCADSSMGAKFYTQESRL